MTEPVTRHRFYVECPRWAGFRQLMLQLAVEYDLKLEIREEKGWLRSAYDVEIVGSESGTRNALASVQASIKEYNSRKNS